MNTLKFSGPLGIKVECISSQKGLRVSERRNLTIVPLLVTLVIAFGILFINQNVYWIIFKAGNPERLVEWLQFGFYFLAGLIFVVAGSRLAHKEKSLAKWIPLMFEIFVLLVALEEISWDQF
jgi:uncharacterized membrane protein YfcA